MGKDLRNKELGLGIIQRKDGLYMARFTNKSGKRIALTDPDLKCLRMRFEKAKVEDYESQGVAARNYSIKEWHDFWIENIKKPQGVTQQYLDHLETAFNKYIIKKDRGNITIREFRMIDVQLIVNEANNDSVTAAINILSVLKQMFNIAYENDLIKKNPAKSIHISKPRRRATEAMSRKDEEVLISHIASQHLKDMVLLMLNTGLRLSELLGLSFDEVDLEKRYICIRHQLSYRRNEEGEYTFAETKNKKSRIIPLNKTAYEILDRNIKKRKPELGKTYRGKSSISDELIFVSSFGDAYNRAGFSSSLGYCIEKAKRSGYEFECPRLSAHIFRHTFATRCLEAGMTPNTVSSLLGHGTIRMTLSYVHNSTEKFREDTELLDKI